MDTRTLGLGFNSIWYWIAIGGAGLALWALIGSMPFGRSRRNDKRPLLTRVVSFIGLSLALHATPANAERRPPVSPTGGAPQGQPWSGTGGFPPPLPLPLARATPRPLESAKPTIHPAIHGSGAPRVVPLFPRVDKPDERAAAMARHPSGRDLAWKSHLGQRRHLDGRLHVVRTGESLWAIAAMQLHSDDPARIARYWHRIYIRNREAIGSDPDLIREGQVLRLPAETDS